MKIHFLFAALFILTSCADYTSSSKKPNIEADELLYITGKTAKNMDMCITYSDPPSCIEAEKLLKENPWLITREFNITNNKGINDEEWQTQAGPIKTNFEYIKTYYQTFSWVNENR